jgi:hypothetical protein
VGSLRLGHITLKPESFDHSTLFYGTHNGGTELETFPLCGHGFDHGAPVSFLVSASHGIGMTGGCAILGDSQKQLRVELDKATAALLGMISYQPIRRSYFCRLTFSAAEMDDTSRLRKDSNVGGEKQFSFALMPNPLPKEKPCPRFWPGAARERSTLEGLVGKIVPGDQTP